MKCPACQAEVPDQTVICPQCGARTDMAPPAAAPAAGPAERFRNTLSPQPGGPSTQYDPEVELWQGGYSPKAMIGWWVMVALVTVALIVAGVLFAAAAPLAWPAIGLVAVLLWLWPLVVLTYRRLSFHYRLTNLRFFHKAGILRQMTDRIELIHVDDIAYEQGIVERMLGVGTLKITSSDRSHPMLVLRGIDNVQRVAGLIDDARRAERRKRGVHIESI